MIFVCVFKGAVWNTKLFSLLHLEGWIRCKLEWCWHSRIPQGGVD